MRSFGNCSYSDPNAAGIEIRLSGIRTIELAQCLSTTRQDGPSVQRRRAVVLRATMLGSVFLFEQTAASPPPSTWFIRDKRIFPISPVLIGRAFRLLRQAARRHLNEKRPSSGAPPGAAIPCARGVGNLATSLTEQRYKHVYLVSCCNDQHVVTGLPLGCRFQNKLGKICLRCRG
jgi:hypothetical protein